MNSNISTELVIKLNEASVARLGDRVQVFTDDRHQIVNSIVHIGVGGFHRAHQALYLDNYFHQKSDLQWGTAV